MDENSTNSKAMEQQVTRDIRFKLSDEEKNRLANDAARITEERNALKTELDLIGRTMRKQIKDQQKEIDRLLKCHKDGTETRETVCREVMNWETKTVSLYHTDANGGELIESRDMHDAELQMKLTTTNETAKVVKEKKKTKAQKNPDKHLTPEELKSQEIAEVHKLETRRGTKKSALDSKELN